MIVLRHRDSVREDRGFAVLLDRDGTVIEDRPGYVRRPQDIRLLPTTAAAATDLAALGADIALVSNQAGIGRGVLTRSQAVELHVRVVGLLASVGVRVTLSLLCPHHPDAKCPCRKPEPGMVHTAVELLGVPPDRSFLVGDAARDVAAAWSAGVDPLLVLTGQGVRAREALRARPDGPYTVVDDLAAAAVWIRRSSTGCPATARGRQPRARFRKDPPLPAPEPPRKTDRDADAR